MCHHRSSEQKIYQTVNDVNVILIIYTVHIKTCTKYLNNACGHDRKHRHGHGLCPDYVLMHLQQLFMFANSTFAKFANSMFADLTFTNSIFAISMFGNFLCLGIRCPVIRHLAIRCLYLRCSVIRSLLHQVVSRQFTDAWSKRPS